MFDFSFDLGTLVPSLVLALLAVVLPMLFRRIVDGFLRRPTWHRGCTFCWKVTFFRLL